VLDLDILPGINNGVNSLKGVSSRMIRLKNYPSIRKKLWGGALWSPSYFAGSCGGAHISFIRQYSSNNSKDLTTNNFNKHETSAYIPALKREVLRAIG